MSSTSWKDLSFLKKAFAFFRVSAPNSSELIVVNRTWFSVILTLAQLGVFVWWYYIVLDLTEIPSDLKTLFTRIQGKVSNHPLEWFFVLAPLLMIPQIYFGLKNILLGETFTFDGQQGLLFKNGYPLVPLADIQEVQMRPIMGGGQHGNYPYRLTVVSANGKKFKIIHMGSEGNIAKLADDIAKVANVEVKKLGFTFF